MHRSRIIPFYLKIFTGFFCGTISMYSYINSLYDPEAVKIVFNGKQVDANFITSLPFLIFGIVSLYFFYWLSRYHYRVEIDDKEIQFLTLFNKPNISWNDVKKIRIFDFYMLGTLIRIETKNNQTLYLENNDTSGKFRGILQYYSSSEMTDFIEEKKKELGI